VTELTVERLREILDYEPETGLMKWKVNRQGHTVAGDKAGRLSVQGYIKIKIQGRTYLRSRLAWLYVHGRWPNQEVGCNAFQCCSRYRLVSPIELSRSFDRASR
jgi:hypothetical protein